MKKIVIVLLLVIFLSGFAYSDIYKITKVNRLEKEWVIPPERLDFFGSYGIKKFNYSRKLDPKEQGEEYIVTWKYRGEEIKEPLVLRFEYKYVNELFTAYVEEYKYDEIDSKTYRWNFKNIGDNFTKKGKIDRWKVSIIKDGNTMAVKRSAMWKGMEGDL